MIAALAMESNNMVAKKLIVKLFSPSGKDKSEVASIIDRITVTVRTGRFASSTRRSSKSVSDMLVNLEILPPEPGVFMRDLAEIGIIVIMFALAMTATAVLLTMASLRAEELHKTKAAAGIMTSAVLDDIASPALVAALVPFASGGRSLVAYCAQLTQRAASGTASRRA